MVNFHFSLQWAVSSRSLALRCLSSRRRRRRHRQVVNCPQVQQLLAMPPAWVPVLVKLLRRRAKQNWAQITELWWLVWVKIRMVRKILVNLLTHIYIHTYNTHIVISEKKMCQISSFASICRPHYFRWSFYKLDFGFSCWSFSENHYCAPGSNENKFPNQVELKFVITNVKI